MYYVVTIRRGRGAIACFSSPTTFSQPHGIDPVLSQRLGWVVHRRLVAHRQRARPPWRQCHARYSDQRAGYPAWTVGIEIDPPSTPSTGNMNSSPSPYSAIT
jgi:hypothetical protein